MTDITGPSPGNSDGNMVLSPARLGTCTFRIQLFRGTLSEECTQVQAARLKSSMGRSIELLHVLNDNEI